MAPAFLYSQDMYRTLPADALVVRRLTEIKRGRPVIAPNVGALVGVATAADSVRRSTLFVDAAVDPAERAWLDVFFERVISRDPNLSVLPSDDFAEAVSSPGRRELIVAGTVAPEAVVLYRGDLEALVVPRDWFVPGVEAPDFGHLEIADFGQTVRLGRYEASSDAILYEFDRDYRKVLQERRLAADNSWGGALRRLRLQKGLKREGFPGLSAKAIARLERGEVGRPHGRTLAAIASRLGVDEDEIGTY